MQLTNMFDIESAINLCQSPKNIPYNFLPSILKIIVAKLNLEGTILSVVPTPGQILPDITLANPADVELYDVLNGGIEMPIDVKSLQLKPIKFDVKEAQVKTLIKISNVNTITTATFYEKELHTDEVRNTKVQTLEKNIEKIGTLLEKMTNQHEILVKRVQMLTQSNVSRSQSFAMKPRKTSGAPGVHVPLDLPWDDMKGHNLDMDCACKKELECVRKECKKNFCELAKKILKLGEKVAALDDRVVKLDYLRKLLSQISTKDQVNELSEKVDFNCCQITKFRKEVSCLRSQVQDVVECTRFMDKRIKEIEKKLEILKKVRELCERMDKLELWKKKVHEEFERFTEITEYLKTTKADREELDYLFEEKADRDELLKLVTLEFFRSVQDDLSGGIVQVLEQLMRNEIEWERAHKEIQLMLDVKADSCEVTSLKRYINCKLEIIQKKLNDLIRNKLTAHAAAVKIRLLQNARCITCTAEADINQLKYPVPVLQPLQRYEVKCLCEPRKRYCGGSHTVLAPDQKYVVKRKLPLKSAAATTLGFNMTKGTNGNWFRTRNQKCICQKEEPPEPVVEKKKSLFPC